jgi:Spy/CpxP family protein refolding chaperone
MLLLVPSLRFKKKYTMKKILLAAILMLSLGSFAQEKSKKGPEMSPEKKVELQVARLKIELDLNEKQTAELRNLIQEHQQKRAKQRAEMGSKKDSLHKPSPAQREQMKKSRADDKKMFEEQLKKILTPAQFETWQQNKEARENKQKALKEKRDSREN